MTVPTLKFDAFLLPGMDRAAGHARRWLRDVLGEHPAFDDAALCMSELITNAVRHVRHEVAHIEWLRRLEVGMVT